jgi:hypothetical protein
LLSWAVITRRLRARGRQVATQVGRGLRRSPLQEELAYDRFRRATIQARKDYAPAPYPGRITVVRSIESEVSRSVWASLSEAGLEWHELPVFHDVMLRQPDVEVLGELLGSILTRAQA